MEVSKGEVIKGGYPYKGRVSTRIHQEVPKFLGLKRKKDSVQSRKESVDVIFFFKSSDYSL